MANIMTQVGDWFGGLNIFDNPMLIVIVLGGILYLLYDRFKGKKPYCFVRIKELRGDIIVDHGKAYKAFIHTMKNDEGKILKWMHISGINRIWRLPKSSEFTPTPNNKLLELLWLGKNTFQVLRTQNYMFEKQASTKLYKRYKVNEHSLGVVPEDLKYLDYELSTNIDALTSNKGWLQAWIDKHGALVLTLLFCFLMVFVTVKHLSTEMSETREMVTGLGDRFTGWIQDQTTTTVDDNTIKGSDLSNVGKGGG